MMQSNESRLPFRTGELLAAACRERSEFRMITRHPAELRTSIIATRPDSLKSSIQSFPRSWLTPPAEASLLSLIAGADTPALRRTCDTTGARSDPNADSISLNGTARYRRFGVDPALFQSWSRASFAVCSKSAARLAAPARDQPPCSPSTTPSKNLPLPPARGWASFSATKRFGIVSRPSSTRSATTRIALAGRECG